MRAGDPMPKNKPLETSRRTHIEEKLRDGDEADMSWRWFGSTPACST